MPASVTVALKPAAGTLVPRSAVIGTSDGGIVLVGDDPRTAERRSVRIEALDSANVILSGVNPGEVLINRPTLTAAVARHSAGGG
jgi:hypothetical protein